MSAAEYTEQAMVTDWPARLFWIGLLIACVAFTLWLVRRSWLRRARRFAGQPGPDRGVVDGEVLASGRYLGSTVAGNWLDRVTAEGFGTPSSCALVLGDGALSFDRDGYSDFTVALAELIAVRTDRGLLGEVYGPDGIIVVTWKWGDVTLDSGFRADPVTDHARVLAGLASYRATDAPKLQGGNS